MKLSKEMQSDISNVLLATIKAQSMIHTLDNITNENNTFKQAKKKEWISYMIECLKALKPCDGIYLIDNWNHSNGAIIEVREYIDNMDEKDKECLILIERDV